MESGLRVSRRRKFGALFMLLGLLTGTFSIFGPQVLADPIDTGSDIGDFEIEGNYALDAPALTDWGSLSDLDDRLYFDDENLDPDPNGPGDQGFVGGAKEFDRSTWGCAADSGKTPAKDDIEYVVAYPSLDISNATVAFSYVRNKPEGNTNVVLELNENSINSCSSTNDRTVGDLILHFDFPGGDGLADLEAYVWNGSAFAPFDVPADVANAATNAASLALPATISDEVAAAGLPTTIEARLMGEAIIDLFALQDALAAADLPVDDVLECPGLGAANIRTRSSGSSDKSQLHDNFPEIAIDLSNCASLKLKKVDDLGQPMAGIQFALFVSEADALAGTPVAQLPSDPPEDLVCTTDAAGVCEFPKVPAGDYFLNEINLPDGYTPDPDLPAPVSLDPFENEDLTDSESEWFVNSLRTGSVVINKVVVDGEGQELDLIDNSYLDGITFELQDNGTVIQKRGGGDATCTLVVPNPDSEASCQIDDVPFGTYDVVEDVSTLPAGLSAGPSVPVTVDEDSPAVAEVDYENPADPLSLSIDKAGPNTANVGDTIDYTFNVGLGDLPFDTADDVDLQPLTDVEVTELINLSDPDQLFDDRCDVSPLTITDKDDIGPLGNDWLENGEIWTYSCQHLVTMAEATDSDGAELWNRAQVEGTDRYGRTDTDTDDHKVTILLPDVTVDKTPDDGVILPGDDAVFTIEVENLGPGRANDVMLEDSLPGDIIWTENSADCSISGGKLTCDFGDLDDGDTASVTVTGATDISDCGELPNTATVSASNELEEDEGNNSDDGLITVSCADVTVQKVAQADPINAGDVAAFDITVTNLSDDTSATGVALSDPLPDGIDWAVSGTDAGDCSISPDSGTEDQVLTCDFGTVEANGTRTVTVSGATDAADCGRLSNTATVSSSNEAPGADDNNESTDTITVNCPDLDIEKSAGSGTVNAGDEVSFTIEVTNHGPGVAYDVTLNDPLPGDITWTDDSDDCSVDGGVLTCDFGDLGDDESASVTVTGTTDPADCGTLNNTATADASNDDPVTDSAAITVQCPDLGITKTADDASVSAGEDVGFTITVTNDGPGVAYDVTLDDPLPSIDGIDWDIVSQSGDAGCAIAGDPGAEVLSCGPVDLADGGSFSVHVVSATQPSGDDCIGGVLPNTATADASNDDPVNDSDSIEVLCPGVNLNKVEDSAIVDLGDEVGFTITVTNTGPGTAFDVVVQDELPAGFDWTVDNGSCFIVLGTLTCDLGDLPAVEEGPQVTIHLTAPTVVDDVPVECADVVNVATATVGNGADPDDSEADLRVRCPIEIDLDKTGDTLAHVGDVVDYQFTVTNTGGEDLLSVELTDPECDAETITLVDDGDGDDVLAAGTWDIEAGGFTGGEVWTYTCERTLTEDDVVIIDGEDFALNTGSVRGEDADGRETSDTDPHEVEIITPAIEVVKTVDDSTPDLGQTVTFSYAVTNTGDTALFDVEVVDDQLGAVGTIDELAPGETVVLTKTMVVEEDSPTVNIATATGSDVLGKTVTDDDPEEITIVLPEVLPRVIPRALPRTGADTDMLMLLAGGLLLLGGLLVVSTGDGTVAVRRRRS